LVQRVLKLSLIYCFAIALLILGLGACAPVKTEKSETKHNSLPPEFEDPLNRAFKDGKELKRRDDAAWVATDAARASGLVDEVDDLSGYVVISRDGRYSVGFVRSTGTAPRAAARVLVSPGDGKGVVDEVDYHPAGKPLTAQEMMHYNALVASRNEQLKLCEGSYNTVVLPPGGGRGNEFHVYYLRAATDPGVIPLAGHVLVKVKAETFEVLERHPLSNSCMEVEKKEEGELKALVLSNKALDRPSAAHIVLMLREGLPLYMKTRNGLVWEVDSTGVGLVE
jgi:hypothetical protein